MHDLVDSHWLFSPGSTLPSLLLQPPPLTFLLLGIRLPNHTRSLGALATHLEATVCRNEMSCNDFKRRQQGAAGATMTDVEAFLKPQGEESWNWSICKYLLGM